MTRREKDVAANSANGGRWAASDKAKLGHVPVSPGSKQFAILIRSAEGRSCGAGVPGAPEALREMARRVSKKERREADGR